MFPNATDQQAAPQDAQQTEQPSAEDILGMIEKPVTEVIRRYVDTEVDFEKTWQLMRIRRVDLYIRGLQYNALDDAGGYSSWAPVGTQPYSNTDGESDLGMYDYVFDIIDSYRKKYIATLGLRPFYNASAVPDDPQSEVDRKAARQAQLCAEWMRNKWNVRVKNIEMFDKQYRGGTVYIHTPFVADKQVFGEMEVPQYQMRQIQIPQPPDPLTGQPQPPKTEEVPYLGEPKKYAGSGPACYMYMGDTVTVPFSCRDFRKTPYLLHEEEVSRGALLQLYGDKLRKRLNSDGEIAMSTETGAQAAGKLTRASEASLTGTYRPGAESVWTHSRYWLASSMYEFVTDDNIRGVLYEKFPDGLKVSRVEGIAVRYENEAINDVWTCVTPYPGGTIYQDPIAWGALGFQDMMNDLGNIAIAKEERGLPSAVADANLIDTDALSKRRYLPKEVIPASPRFGGSLREAIVPLPTPNKDDGAADILLQRIEGNVQSLFGLLPSVWGGQSTQETASGQRMEISQGLMQLGVPGEMVSQGYAEAYLKGCKLIAKYMPQGFPIPVPEDQQGMTSEMLDLDALRSGNYHFEAEPGMPMSRAEQVQMIDGIIKENPDLAAQMGFQDPMAAPILRDFVLPGIPEFPSPIKDVRDKVIERIQVLLQQEPIPGVPDPMSGQPGPPMPSVQPDPFVDDFSLHATLTREWCNSGAGRKAANDPQRVMGYQNVIAYGMLCASQATPPPPPPPPPQPPKINVSLKGEDLVPLGLVPAIQQDFQVPPGAPPQGPMGPGGPPPAPPQGGPPGPPPNNGPMPHPVVGGHPAPPETGIGPMPPASGAVQ